MLCNIEIDSLDFPIVATVTLWSKPPTVVKGCAVPFSPFTLWQTHCHVVCNSL
jgi:hypothetical protein